MAWGEYYMIMKKKLKIVGWDLSRPWNNIVLLNSRSEAGRAVQSRDQSPVQDISKKQKSPVQEVAVEEDWNGKGQGGCSCGWHLPLSHCHQPR